jgi:tRNA nucleotidyltransferase (CCA-adding enzyme)
MPSIPRQVVERLEQAGFEAFAVGGCVRDTLLSLQPGDFDITTSAKPFEVEAVFQNEKVILTGAQHGTITVLIQGNPVEITTYRIDGDYTDSRHPNEVTFTSSLYEDLKRRDFTVNAMVWHPHLGIADYFNGAEDLKNGILRTVGDPLQRFSEDALRILRGLRFAATYPLTLHPDTEKAAFSLADTLLAVSKERIKTELEKLLLGDFAGQVLSRYSGIFKEILPQVFDGEITHLPLLSSLPKDPVTRLAFLLWETGETATDILSHNRWDNETVRQVNRLVSCKEMLLPLTKPALCRMLATLGEADSRRFIAIQSVFSSKWKNVDLALTNVLQQNPCYTLKQLAVTGEHLLALGYEGKEIGQALQRLLDAVIDGKCVNETASLLKYLQ